MAKAIPHTITDTDSNITFRVYAYTNLTRGQVLAVIRHYLLNCKKKNRPKKGSTVEIHTVIDDRSKGFL